MPFTLLYSVSGKTGAVVSHRRVAGVCRLDLWYVARASICFRFNVRPRSWNQRMGKVGSFFTTAVLFFLFSVPLYLWCTSRRNIEKVSIVGAYRDVWEGLRQTHKYPVLRFLIADYFIEERRHNGNFTIGLYCSVVLSLANTQITAFLIISTASAVVGAFAIGKIAERWSQKPDDC